MWTLQGWELVGLVVSCGFLILCVSLCLFWVYWYKVEGRGVVHRFTLYWLWTVMELSLIGGIVICMQRHGFRVILCFVLL